MEEGQQRQDEDLEAGVDVQESRKAQLEWSTWTTGLAILASLAMVLLYVPAILSSQYRQGSSSYWKLQASSALANLSMLAYFNSRRERAGAWVQSCCLLTSVMVQLQLAMVGAMPLVTIKAMAIACIMGAFQGRTPRFVWSIWSDALCLTITSSLVDLVLASILESHSVLPVILTAMATAIIIVLTRLDYLPETAPETISTCAATILWLWSTTLQMMDAGVPIIVLSIIGNGLQLPRALFNRDILWFSGAMAGTVAQGWGFLLKLYLEESISDTFFWATTWSLGIWLSKMLHADAQAHGLVSAFDPILELLPARTANVVMKTSSKPLT